MRKLHQGGMFVLALALAAPSFLATRAAVAKTAAATSDDTAPSGMSKEDQDKLKEHNKLRTEIKKVKYPAAKATIVAHVKGIKTDDKKWFDQTLPGQDVHLGRRGLLGAGLGNAPRLPRPSKRGHARARDPPRRSTGPSVAPSRLFVRSSSRALRPRSRLSCQSLRARADGQRR